MLPEEIQKLRKELACTARELAEALGLDQKEVMSWEAGETFPTKRLVSAMLALKAKGPSAIPRKARGKAAPKVVGTARLREPAFWTLVHKLVEHPDFFAEVQKLAEKYPDPTGG
jgi:transcriptional regulator with XRE-family HTH domain